MDIIPFKKIKGSGYSFGKIWDTYDEQFRILRDAYLTLNDSFVVEEFTDTTSKIKKLKNSYTPGQVFVYINNVIQWKDVDYEETDGNTITLLKDIVNEDKVRVITIHVNLSRDMAQASSATGSAQSESDSVVSASSSAMSASYSAAAAKNSASEASISADNAKNSETLASSYKTVSANSASSASYSALSAKRWAEAMDSPDGVADTDSSTGLTQSARSWALSAKASADEAKNHLDEMNPPVYYLDSDGCLCEKIFVEVTE